jgi:hypothetical protein
MNAQHGLKEKSSTMNRALGVALVAILAATPAALRPAHATPPAPFHTATRTVRYGPIRMNVPQSWPPGMVSWTVSNDEAGGMVGYLLPNSPKPAGLTDNPLNASPYFTETLVTQQDMTTATLSEATADGREYTMTFNVPDIQTRLARAILASLQVPPPITSTQVVHLLLSQDAGVSVKCAAGGRTWFLVGGPGGAGQEPFYLFRSSDGGRRWALADQTRWTGTPFPDESGMTAMRFWSRSDGIIVEASGYAHHQIWIYRTQDGGTHWTQTNVTIPVDITASERPAIHVGPRGLLTVRVVLSKSRIVVLRGSIHNRRWRLTPERI